ncbi:MAG: ABC transporter ATP-binding protein [Egibacteraceae bacterium]
MLEIRGLRRKFGEVVALDGLSFSVGRGQVFGFVGANGAGKTTTMRIIMGVERAESGEVWWQGKPADRATRRRFGYMPEERGLYPKMRVANQLTYLAQLHGVGAADAVASTAHWLERLGLAGRAASRLEQLSHGNQQRVQLAAALVSDPVLLVLDEPFAGLDPTGTDALSDVLLDLASRQVPVLFSSHQLELVERLCDAVAIIDHGKLVAAGTVEELRRGRGELLWRVDVAADHQNWMAHLRGVTVERYTDRGVVLRLENGSDEQAVLDAARAAGPVSHFGAVSPTLAELYREAVSP